MGWKRFAGNVALGLVIVSLLIGTASAQPSVSTSTTYNGTDGNSQQILVEVTVSPDVVTENLTATFRPTPKSFLIYRSFERTQPDGVTISNPSTGTYVVDELRPGQEVQFQFVAYPKEISSESVNVATVRTSSNQNPNEQSTTVSANLSSSPYLELQERNSEIQSLQTQVTTMRAGFWGGLGVGVLGLLGVGLLFRKTKSMVPESDVCDDLRSIRTGVSGDSNQRVVDRYLEDYGCDSDDGGLAGTGPAPTTQEESSKPAEGDTESGKSDTDDDDIGPLV